MDTKVKELINRLELSPHPEEGYYKETYRSSISVNENNLPERFGGRRSMATSILFLLPEGAFSSFHRLKQDEVWYYQQGSPLVLHFIDFAGTYSSHVLGPTSVGEASPQLMVHAGTLFAAEPMGHYSLAGCMATPGFDFADLYMPGTKQLVGEFPKHEKIIRRLSRTKV